MNVDSLLHTPSQVISSLDYRRERWRNGLGWTREILRLPAQGDDWALRLSVAEIEQDAAFSTFPGVERELVLLQGNGVRLRFEDGRVAQVLPPHGRVRFAGEEALHGELVDGTAVDSVGRGAVIMQPAGGGHVLRNGRVVSGVLFGAP